MGAGAVGDDWRSGGGGKFGELSRGCAATEVIEVGVVLESDEAMLVDMLQGALLTLFWGVG